MKRYEFVLYEHIAHTVFIDAENEEEAEKKIDTENLWNELGKYGDAQYGYSCINITDPKDEA